MKKRNGFTLVELLAVIVVLALIMIIAIPSVLNTLNASKKESFYLYANSLQSKAIAKYTQDLNGGTQSSTDCSVYDIKTDLGLSDTGSYEGWVKVNRVAVNDGTSNYEFDLTDNTHGISYVKYCTTEDGSSCTPDKSYGYSNEVENSVKVVQTLPNGSGMCVSYQYGDELTKKLVTVGPNCNPDSVTANNNTYEYQVSVTIKSSDYAVSDYVLSAVDDDATDADESASMEAFYKAIDDFKENNKKLVISEPTCNGTSSGETKGEKETSTTIVTTTADAGKGSKEVTTQSTQVAGTTNVSENTTTTRRIIGADEITTTNAGETIVTEATTKERETVEAETTTVDVQDTSLLLSTLNITGQDIGFSPLTFYYELDVPNTVSSLTVSATAATPDVTTVVIDGNQQLSVGSNVIVITLTSSKTNKTSYYRIKVNRYNEYNQKVTTTKSSTTSEAGDAEGAPDPDLEESDATLKTLRIAGYPILFDKNTYSYSVEVDSNVDELTLTYETNVEFAMATVSGNEKLENGSEVVVTVVSPNKYYTKKYTIVVNKKNTASTSTKILRGVAVGLGVILLGCVAVIAYSKAKAKKMIKNKMKEKTDQNVATAIPVQQQMPKPEEHVVQKRLTPNDYVGMDKNPQPVSNVFSSGSNKPSTPSTPTETQQNNDNNGNNLGA